MLLWLNIAKIANDGCPSLWNDLLLCVLASGLDHLDLCRRIPIIGPPGTTFCLLSEMMPTLHTTNHLPNTCCLFGKAQSQTWTHLTAFHMSLHISMLVSPICYLPIPLGFYPHMSGARPLHTVHQSKEDLHGTFCSWGCWLGAWSAWILNHCPPWTNFLQTPSTIAYVSVYI